tara:strand:- start:850 stop:3150 length:2301 start_codon:yes stop_codon:yes gene_type:complete
MNKKIQKLVIAGIIIAGIGIASTALAAADFEVTQVGRNVTRGDITYGTTVIANAGTEEVLINVDVINIGDEATTASTTLSANLPGDAEYIADSTKYFSMACGNFVSGCAIADSAEGTAFPLDDPYVIGVLTAGEDLTIQYKIIIADGTEVSMTIDGAAVTDDGISGSGSATTVTPDLPPTLALNGASTINLFVGETYAELGVTAVDETDGDISADVVITGTVNTSAVGTYTRAYNITDSSGNAAPEITREVVVELDAVRPTISLTGASPVVLVAGTPYSDGGATASDNIDGDITGQIVLVNPVDINTTSTYSVTYNVTDSSGNDADEVTRTVLVIETPDTEKPVITLNGASEITLTVGDAFAEAGATAVDNVEGDVSASIITAGDTVDSNTAGTYTITYNVSDSSGNDADEVTRTVTVEEAPAASPVVVVTAGSPGGSPSGSAPRVGTHISNTSIVINNTAENTNSRTVTLTLSAVNAVNMIVANDEDFTGAEWEPFASSKDWTLSEGDGRKEVFAKFSDIGSNVTGRVSDSILLQKAQGQEVVEVVLPPDTAQFIFTRNLTIGSTGNDVTELQKRLTVEGVYTGPITGYFGPLTLGGAKAYQMVESITPVSGFVGPLTRGALNGKAAVVTPPTTTPPVSKGDFQFITDLSYGVRGGAVTELQERLTAEGVYTGPITGYFGPLTLGGVKAYQRKAGLTASGYVGVSTRASLNTSEASTIATPEITPDETIAAPTTPEEEEIVKAQLQERINFLQAQVLDLLERLAR